MIWIGGAGFWRYKLYLPNMRDWHVPCAKDHPASHQSRAKCARGKEGADDEIAYCGKMRPMGLVRSGREVLLRGPTRPDLFRISPRRGCVYVNNSNSLTILPFFRTSQM